MPSLITPTWYVLLFIISIFNVCRLLQGIPKELVMQLLSLLVTKSKELSYLVALMKLLLGTPAHETLPFKHLQVCASNLMSTLMLTEL